MSLIKPFAGLRPAPGRANDVVAPPYDVMSRSEAKAMVDGRPWSFLHISRPEIDLPDNTDPYAAPVYDKARENLDRMLNEDVLVRDPAECYYVYRLTMDAHVQTGLVAAASVAAYDENRIKKHEFTRPVKEDDRVRQIDALNAQTGPVFLVYPSAMVIDDTLNRVSDAFATLPALYVADGHHRSAAGSRVAAKRKAENPAHTGEESYNYFLSAIFPHNQMQILDYNRVVRDLNGADPAAFLAQVGRVFDIEAAAAPVRPAKTGEYGAYLAGIWYRLSIHLDRIPADDPVARLDVSLLQDHLIEPLLGISDPRRDDRIDFVGGIRGLSELQRRVDSGDWAVAFALFPTTMEALMAVADAGEVMPPKSTWFEPKLADGLVTHVLD